MMPLSWKIGAALALCGLLTLFGTATYHHVLAEGVKQESVRRDAIDAANTIAANRALMALNERLRSAQAALTAAQSDLQRLQQENDRGKAISSDLQRRLLAGNERLSVLVKAGSCHPDPAGSPASSTAAAVDTGTGLVYDLDPAVAAGLEGIRAGHNDAVNRLAACVKAYEAVKTAADAMP
jgi:hypothetical protein